MQVLLFHLKEKYTPPAGEIKYEVLCKLLDYMTIKIITMVDQYMIIIFFFLTMVTIYKFVSQKD